MAYTTRITFQGAMLDFLQAESERFGQPIGDIVRNCVRDAMAKAEPRPTRSAAKPAKVETTTVVAETCHMHPGQPLPCETCADLDAEFCHHGRKLTYDPENSCPQCIEEFLRS